MSQVKSDSTLKEYRLEFGYTHHIADKDQIKFITPISFDISLSKKIPRWKSTYFKVEFDYTRWMLPNDLPVEFGRIIARKMFISHFGLDRIILPGSRLSPTLELTGLFRMGHATIYMASTQLRGASYFDLGLRVGSSVDLSRYIGIPLHPHLRFMYFPILYSRPIDYGIYGKIQLSRVFMSVGVNLQFSWKRYK